MKSLNRTLSLVLVLAMCLGLMGVASATSSTYTDAGTVGAAYAEAVDLLTGIGVVNGTTATTLEPTGNYTREQAAKVICYLTLGKTTADALVCSTAPFTDVAANRWSAGFIQYCVSQGIINGMGDGTFNPTGALTGYAWGKMLLGALGYGKTSEYTGAGWEIAVAKDAMTLKIFKGDTAAATNATISRQQAMLMGFNTMFLNTTKPTYQWDGGKKYISDYNAVGASFASTAYGYGATSGSAYTSIANATGLTKVASTVNGSAGYTWYYKSTTTPASKFYTDETVIGTTTAGTALSTLTTYSTTNAKYIAKVLPSTVFNVNGTAQASLGATAFSASTAVALNAYVVYNGAIYKCTTAHAAGAWLATDFTAYNIAENGKGVEIKFVDTDDDTTTAEKVYVTTYTVDVVKAAPVVKTNTADGKDYVYVDMATTDIGGSGSIDYSKKTTQVTGYTGLAANDVVCVTNLDSGDIAITKATAKTGSASAQVGTTPAVTALTVDGTSIDVAANASTTVKSYAEGFLNSVAFYTDAYGYLVYAKAVTLATSDYAFILANDTYIDTVIDGGHNKSAVVFKDGTTATITVASVNGVSYATGGVAIKPDLNNVYTYSKNTDGTYALVPKTEVVSKAVADLTLADSDGVINKGVSAATSAAGTGIKGDANTIYVVRDIKTAGTHAYDTTYKTTWAAYTGYTNVITAANAYYVAVNDTNGYADIVYVYYYTTTATTASNVIYLLDATPTAVYKDATTVDYYTFPAVIDGAKTVVKSTSFDATVYDAGTNTDGLAVGAALTAGTLCSVVYTDGKLTPGSVTPLYSGIIAADAAGANKMKGSFINATGIKAPVNGIITIGSTGYSYVSGTYVFVINADKTTVTPGLADSISDNTNAKIYAVTDAAAVVKAGGTPTAAQQNSLYAIFIQLT